MIRNIIFTLLIFCNFPLFSQIEIDRGPYLQQSTATGITIQWRTEEPTESIVWYGSAVGNLNQTASTPGTAEDHTVEINGLNANSTYFYAVGDSTGILSGNTAEFYFKTNPAIGSNTPFRAWIQGDAGVGTQVQRDTRDGFLTFLGDGDIDLMLMLGDNAYSDGKQSEYQDALFNDMYENIMNKSVLWPTLGNHDSYSTDEDTRTGPYYDIFTLPKNGEAGGTPSGTEAYYSYDYANAHFVCLNSDDVDTDPSGEMAQWIHEDLGNTQQDWIIAYFHHPIYSGAHNNESDDGTRETLMREEVLPILEMYNIDLVLYGHTHNYQRSFLVKDHYGDSNTFDTLTMTVDDGSGILVEEAAYTKLNGERGAVFICLGNAAKEEGEPEEDLNHPTTYIGRDLLGSASLEIKGEQLDFKFVLQDGSVEDHFTILKAINPLTVEITNPANNQHFPNLQNINITADAADEEGSVTQVEFFINGNSIGTDFNIPYAVNWHPLHAGSYTIKAVATDNDGFKKSATHYITVGQTTTTCVQIDQETDDAEQRENGSVNLTSGDIELIADGNDDQIVGLRFNNLNIPRGAAISSAYLNFKVKNDANENPCLLTIAGQKGLFTTTFTSATNNISNRPRSNNSITWSPPNWNTENATQTSPNIGAILQEIVLQESYSPGQSIVLIIEGIGSRNAISFDQGDGSNAPELCVTMDAENCLDSDFDGTCDIDDLCPGSPEPGQPCNDNYSGTFNDLITNNCICQGTLHDCPDLAAQYGDACNDGNSGTYDDRVTTNCECAGTPYDCPDLQAQFNTLCNDNDPGTFSDLITTDCECAGTPYDCPDLQLQFGAPCDDNNPFTCHDVITNNCDCAGTPTSDEATLSSQINQDSDDAEERANGSVTTTSSDLEIITDNSDQVIGLRFENPGIPPGTVLSNANIQFTVDETKNTNPSDFLIYGERTSFASTFTTSSNNISNRTKTNASINWSPDNWESIGDNGPAQLTPNLAPLLQEIINLNSYSINTPFVIIIEGSGRRVAVSHDKNSNDAPVLNISYSSSLDDSDGDGVCDDEDLCFGPEPGSPCNDNNTGTYNDIVNNYCQCIGTFYDCPTLGADIGASCNDGNNSTFNDYVNSNCECVGSLFQCPLLNANIGDACNDNNPLTVNDQVNASCNCVGQAPVAIEVCDRVSNNADDSEEKSNGNCNINSSDLELVSDKGDIQLVGLRFRDLSLQQGVSVVDAYIQFTVDKNNNSNPCNLTIHGQLSPDPAVFTKSNNDISDRALTNASVNWSPEEWEDNGDSGPAQRSTNIGPIIQEIVNQPGFDQNSPIVLIISGEGLRQAISHDEDDATAAELCVGVYESATIQGLSSQETEADLLARANQVLSNKEDNTISPYLTVFPNPAKTAITASFSMSDDGPAILNVLDMHGRVLGERQSIVQKGANRISMPLADLPNGVYFLTLRTNSAQRVTKFSILN